VQDEEGSWHFFYWGPENETPNFKEVLLMSTIGVPTNCVVVKIEGEPNDYTVSGITDFLRTSDSDFVINRADLVTDVVAFEGDYTKTYKHIKILEKCSHRTLYNLLHNNCAQNSWTALAKSDDRFRKASCPAIPDISFIKVKAIEYRRSVS